MAEWLDTFQTDSIAAGRYRVGRLDGASIYTVPDLSRSPEYSWTPGLLYEEGSFEGIGGIGLCVVLVDMQAPIMSFGSEVVANFDGDGYTDIGTMGIMVGLWDVAAGTPWWYIFFGGSDTGAELHEWDGGFGSGSFPPGQSLPVNWAVGMTISPGGQIVGTVGQANALGEDAANNIGTIFGGVEVAHPTLAQLATMPKDLRPFVAANFMNGLHSDGVHSVGAAGNTVQFGMTAFGWRTPGGPPGVIVPGNKNGGSVRSLLRVG